MVDFSMKAKKFLAVGSIAIFTGGLIYLLFRPNVYAVRWVPENKYLLLLRESLRWMGTPFVKYYLADYLWAVALSCGLHLIFSPKVKGSCICTTIVLLYGLTFELSQYCGFISGTGDLWDVLMYILAGISVNILNLSRSRKK